MDYRSNLLRFLFAIVPMVFLFIDYKKYKVYKFIVSKLEGKKHLKVFLLIFIASMALNILVLYLGSIFKVSNVILAVLQGIQIGITIVILSIVGNYYNSNNIESLLMLI